MLLIEYYGKQIITLKGNDAKNFLNKINHANNDKEKQLIMAKITGNFKRGNERK
ncbi:ABC transporter ATP-binding protein [Bacillus cereus]|nr:ABC transporter ATP-binding protein [Bacillus cereus]